MNDNLRTWAFTATEIAAIEARQKIIDDQNAKMAAWSAEEQRLSDLQRYTAEELALFDAEYDAALAERDRELDELAQAKIDNYLGIDEWTENDQHMLDESRGK